MTPVESGMNLAIAVGGLIICAFGLAQALAVPHVERTTKRYLISIFVVLIAYLACNLFGQISDDFDSPTWAMISRVELALESVLSALAAPILTAFVLHASGDDDWSSNRSFRINALLFGIYSALLVWTQFSGAIYYIDNNNVYHRGPIYPVLLIPVVLIMLVNVSLIWRRRHALTPRQRLGFLAYMGIPAVCMVWQMFYYGVYTILLGTAVGALFMATITLLDSSEQYWQQEAELAQMRSEIMLSQIQPHFLSNTLGAIGRLCTHDPEARDAIRAFSRYLRGNVNALSGEAMSPFENELAHAKTYLELERLRFGDDLQVAYDIGCTDFLLPTFTLQPLVENAVRHGIRKTEEGTGIVAIATRAQDDCWKIVVSDDGVGYDPSTLPTDSQQHIGLTNVAERIRLICGGELRIDSSPGKGTVATITLPKEHAVTKSSPEAY